MNYYTDEDKFTDHFNAPGCRRFMITFFILVISLLTCVIVIHEVRKNADKIDNINLTK